MSARELDQTNEVLLHVQRGHEGDEGRQRRASCEGADRTGLAAPDWLEESYRKVAVRHGVHDEEGDAGILLNANVTPVTALLREPTMLCDLR